MRHAGVFSGACVGQITPVTELCNNKDDNCDGTVDENVTQACYTGPERFRYLLYKDVNRHPKLKL